MKQFIKNLSISFMLVILALVAIYLLDKAGASDSSIRIGLTLAILTPLLLMGTYFRSRRLQSNLRAINKLRQEGRAVYFATSEFAKDFNALSSDGKILTIWNLKGDQAFPYVQLVASSSVIKQARVWVAAARKSDGISISSTQDPSLNAKFALYNDNTKPLKWPLKDVALQEAINQLSFKKS